MPVAIEKIRHLESELSAALPRIGDPRARILRYALSPDFLSEQTYSEFQSSGNTLADFVDTDAGCLAGLLWARCFYEAGNGGNPRVVVGEYLRPSAPPTEADKNKFIALIARRWGLSATDRDVLLRECWIVGGSDAQTGHASNIWKALRTILPAVRNLHTREPTCDLDEIIDTVAYASQDSALPSYLQDLIDARDPDFADSLLACCQLNDDHAWLAKIHSNAVSQRFRQEAQINPVWLLRKNGNICEVILGFTHANVTDGELVVSSSSNAFAPRKIPAHSINSAELPATELGALGDLRWQIGHESRSRLDVLPPEDNIFFRFSPNESIHRWVNPEGSALLSNVRQLYLLSRNAAPQFTLGNTPVRCEQIHTSCPIRIGDRGAYNLFLLDFADFTRAEPQELLLDGRKILRMGSRPSIEVANLDGTVELIDRVVPVRIVRGTSAILVVRNLPQGETCTEVRVKPEGVGKIERRADGSFSLSVDQLHSGIEIRVAAGCGRQRIEGARIIFLPGDNNWPPEGWRWETETHASEVRRYAYQLKEVGKLVNGKISLACAIPLRNPIWWFRVGMWEEKTPNEQHARTQSHSELDQLSLTVCSPIDAALRLNDRVLRVVPGREPLSLQLGTVVKPEISISVEAINQQRTDCLSLSAGAQSWRLLDMVCVPDRPVVRVFGEIPHVFLPDERSFNCENVEFYVLKESDLLDPNWNRNLQPFDLDLQPREFCAINGLVRKSCEGCWLIITPQGRLPRSWIGFVLSLGLRPDVWCYEIYGENEGIQQPFNDLVGSWSGNGHLDANKRVQLRGLLDLLSTTQCVRKGIFKRAVDSREFLPDEGSPDAWTSYFRAHCVVIENLPAVFGSMLSSGFNWIAHPKWISRSYSMFRDEFKIAGKKWTQGAKQKLLTHAPLVLIQHAIESGFPNEHPDRLPIDSYIGPQLYRDIQDAQALCIQTRTEDAAVMDSYDSGIGWRGFGEEKRRGLTVHTLKLHSGLWLAVELYRYHQQVLVSKPNGQTSRIKLKVGVELNAVRHILTLEGAAPDERDSFCSSDEREALQHIYSAVLELSHNVLGAEANGLGRLLRLCGDAEMLNRLFSAKYGESDRISSASALRADLFRLALICRLHAWHEWSEDDEYPAGWPLSDQHNYGLVCVLLARCWQRVDTCRQTLIKDLVRIEWLLAWFHQD